MGETYKKWNVGLPGGPAGPFYSVISQDGMIVANQIPKKEIADLIAAIPELLKSTADPTEQILELEEAAGSILFTNPPAHRPFGYRHYGDVYTDQQKRPK